MRLFQMSPSVPELSPFFQSWHKFPPTPPAPTAVYVTLRAEKVKRNAVNIIIELNLRFIIQVICACAAAV